MSWDLTGMRIEALYLNEYKIQGSVISSRVKYGGSVQHTVKLDSAITLPWNSTARDVLYVNHRQILSILE